MAGEAGFTICFARCNARAYVLVSRSNNLDIFASLNDGKQKCLPLNVRTRTKLKAVWESLYAVMYACDNADSSKCPFLRWVSNSLLCSPHCIHVGRDQTLVATFRIDVDDRRETHIGAAGE